MKKVIVIVCLALAVSSCSLQNFHASKAINPLKDSALWNYDYVYKIRSGDKLTISILNHDDLSVGSTFNIYSSNEVYGKWVMVDEAGKVLIPALGELKVEGLSIAELKDTVIQKLNKQIVNPTVLIKVLNTEVSILGEVKNPGNYVVDKNINTLTEIISRAGGMDFYADKSNILITRPLKNGTAKTFKVDCTKMPIEQISTIVLNPGDLIFVPTKAGKMIDKKSPSIVPFTSIITALVIIFKLF